MDRIVLGIPTYQHPETIKHVLSVSCDTYKACEIDVYYYDSSEDEITQSIVESYISKGYDNLYYVRCRGLRVDQKTELFYSGIGLEKEYDYYWLMKDRGVVGAADLLHIYRYILFEHPDAVLINTYGNHSTNETHIMTDPAELYRKYAWEATSIDTVLLGRKRLLDRVNLKTDPITENDPRVHFYHYDTLFKSLSEINSPKICVISEPSVQILHSLKSTSSWLQHILEIWVEAWVIENEQLPSLYDPYKAEVIRSEALPELLRSGEEGVKQLCKEGILSSKNLTDQFLNNWEKISPISIARLKEICAEQKQL